MVLCSVQEENMIGVHEGRKKPNMLFNKKKE
jgi:hypothetical protein